LYSLHFVYLGNHEQSLLHRQRAVELDPLNLNALDNLASEYFHSRQFYQVIDYEKKILEIDPTYAKAHLTLSDAYRFAGKYDLWLEEWQKGIMLNNDAEDLALFKAVSQEYAKSGYRAALRRLATLQEEQAKRIYVDPAWIAGTFALLGEKDRAFSLLEKAYKEKSGGLPFIKSAPNFDALRSDPRYADLLKRMGLPP